MILFKKKGNYEGSVLIYDCIKKEIIKTIKTTDEETPITSLRWRPSTNYKAKKILMVANTDGSLSQW